MSRMMKTCRLALISAVLLAYRPGASGVTIDKVSEDGRDGRYAERTGLRMLKHHSKARNPHHHQHAHHKAIQDMFAEEQAKLASNEEYEQSHDHDDNGGSVDDDDGDYYGYNDNHHDNQPMYYDIHFPEYLDEDITPRPFQNCVPESFHEANTHGKKHHHKGHHQTHDYGGLDHHHHKHTHKGDYLGDYKGIDDEIGSYYSKSKKAGKKGKRGHHSGREGGKAGKKGKSKSAKSSKSGKSKGYYDRQRRLTGRNHNGGGNGLVRRGHRGGRRHHAAQGRVKNRAGHTLGDKDTEESDHADDSMQVDEEHDEGHDERSGLKVKKNKKHKDGRNHHAHAHTHEKGGLPLCPSVAPKRRTFGPVPTIAPREPSTAPVPTIAGNETMAESRDEPVEPIEEDAGEDTGPVEAPEDAGPASNVESPEGTERILLESAISYGFSAEATPREPTMEEVDALLERTSVWYTDQLKAVYPTLDSFMAEFLATNTDLTADQPVTVEFNSNAFFPEGSEMPTPNELFASMEGLDYQNYIMSAVRTPDMSGGIFEDVLVAGFNARLIEERR